MEKYFRVTEKSPLCKDYLEYKDNAYQVNEHVKKFMELQGIESSSYVPYDEQLYIVPTAADSEKFVKALGKSASGLTPLRKNSTLNKAWVQSLKNNNLKIKRKPFMGIYFNYIMGRFSTRLFDVDNIVYCSIDAEHPVDTPEGMEEMKASEFFKIIEDSK